MWSSKMFMKSAGYGCRLWSNLLSQWLQAFYIQFINDFNTVSWLMKHALVAYYHTIFGYYITTQVFLSTHKLVVCRLNEYKTYNFFLFQQTYTCCLRSSNYYCMKWIPVIWSWQQTNIKEDIEPCLINRIFSSRPSEWVQ